ncbi:unnamed protein product [Discula destructiva]
MKAFSTLIFASVALAATLKEHNQLGSLGVEPSTAPTAGNSTGPNCGVGYTYCGYILKEQKNFDVATILTAYCAGGYCDSKAGSTDTDPLQALFVCLPETAIPKRDLSTQDDAPPYTGPVKIELLCACSGTPFGGGENVCLNPDGDHIGRCSNACENTS